MGTTCYGNAICETSLPHLSELIDHERFTTRTEAQLALFEFIEGWYGPRRIHTSLDHQSPLQYEEQYQSAIGT